MQLLHVFSYYASLSILDTNSEQTKPNELVNGENVSLIDLQKNQNSDTKTEKNLDPGNESSNPHTDENSDPIIKTDTTPKRDFSLEPIKQ